MYFSFLTRAAKAIANDARRITTDAPGYFTP
jgi:hypothetical protein